MTVQKTPCETSPEDWFIQKDGKQYRDDDFLTDAEVRGLTRSVLRIDGETAEEHRDRVDRAIATAEADRKRAALQRRRHAREACHLECPLRLQCLGLGMMPENLEHGIWGGYYAEERQQIEEVRLARIAERQEASSPSGE